MSYAERSGLSKDFCFLASCCLRLINRNSHAHTDLLFYLDDLASIVWIIMSTKAVTTTDGDIFAPPRRRSLPGYRQRPRSRPVTWPRASDVQGCVPVAGSTDSRVEDCRLPRRRRCPAERRRCWTGRLRVDQRRRRLNETSSSCHWEMASDCR